MCHTSCYPHHVLRHLSPTLCGHATGCPYAVLCCPCTMLCCPCTVGYTWAMCHAWAVGCQLCNLHCVSCLPLPTLCVAPPVSYTMWSHCRLPPRCAMSCLCCGLPILSPAPCIVPLVAWIMCCVAHHPCNSLHHVSRHCMSYCSSMHCALECHH